MAKKKSRKAALKIDSHILVPRHSKLSKEETKALFERYNATSKELPKILKNDSAIAHLNVEAGDIIKIVRKSPTAGENTVFYRSVSG